MIWILWIYLAIGLCFGAYFNVDAVLELIGILIGILITAVSWPALLVVRAALKRHRPDNSATTVLQRRAG